MKKHLSVLSLWLQLKLPKALGLMGLMSALELALFGLALRKNHPWTPGVDELFRSCGISGIFFVAFVLLMLLLGRSRSEAGYTLARLSVRQESAALWEALSNLGILLLLWAVQLALVLGMCRWYRGIFGLELQSTVLALYRMEFLHFLLPLRHKAVWASNVLSCLAAALVSAVDGYRIRRGRRSFTSVGLIVMISMNIAGDPTWYICSIFLSGMLIAVSMIRLVMGWREGASLCG